MSEEEPQVGDGGWCSGSKRPWWWRLEHIQIYCSISNSTHKLFHQQFLTLLLLHTYLCSMFHCSHLFFIFYI